MVTPLEDGEISPSTTTNGYFNFNFKANGNGNGGPVLDANQLMNQAALRGLSINWLQDAEKVEQVKTLKEIAMGNCRLLYGSDRFKFYDIVIAESIKTSEYCAVMTCNQEGQTKLLRRAISDCPVKAVRTMVQGLQVDTGLLFTKYDVGAQLRGQQGTTNKDSGNFELDENRGDERARGADDDTASLRYHDPPKGPRGHRVDRGVIRPEPFWPVAGTKRVRFEDEDATKRLRFDDELKYDE